MSYNPAGVGVPWQWTCSAGTGSRPASSSTPLPALVYGIAPIRAMIEPILAAGQEVQLHAHSFWSDLALGAATTPASS
jgi:hypothetical protein